MVPFFEIWKIIWSRHLLGVLLSVEHQPEKGAKQVLDMFARNSAHSSSFNILGPIMRQRFAEYVAEAGSKHDDEL
jgi:hypothetical protein